MRDRIACIYAQPSCINLKIMKLLSNQAKNCGGKLFFGGLMACGLAFHSGCANAQQPNNAAGAIRPATQKPNLILIVADDLGFGDLGVTGSIQLQTPNIDRLAKTGTFFSQGYVSSAVCSPSRAGLMTGINGVEFGYTDNLGGGGPGNDGSAIGLPTNQKTLATMLKPAGYATGLVGKWHLGSKEQFAPTNRGFDDFWGFRSGGHDYFRAGGKGYKAPIECNYKKPQEITYLTDDLGDENVAFIRKHKNQPFFLYSAFNAPHTPMQATEADLKKFDYIPDKKRRTYAAMVYRLDVNVGKIMDEVQKQGIANNTMIVFFSDNGGPIGHNASLNAPYRGQKGTLLEGGVHTPFIMNWPGKIAAGRVFADPVMSLDVAPTISALAGDETLKPTLPFTGVDLMPYLTGAKTGLADRELKWHFTAASVIRRGNWKLIRLPDRLPMLYDLQKDVSEQNDVAMNNMDTTQEMLGTLGYWEVRLPYELFSTGPKWKLNSLGKYDAEYILTQPARDGKLVYTAPSDDEEMD